VSDVLPVTVLDELGFDPGQRLGLLGLGGRDLREVPIDAPDVPPAEPVVAFEFADPVLQLFIGHARTVPPTSDRPEDPAERFVIVGVPPSRPAPAGVIRPPLDRGSGRSGRAPGHVPWTTEQVMPEGALPAWPTDNSPTRSSSLS
jgi:hypothetical protein